MICNKKLIPTIKEHILVDPEEIIYFQGKNKGTSLVMEGSNEYEVQLTLKELASRLDCRFLIRIHHSFVVNLRHVIKVKGCFEKVVLTNGEEIPISRRKRPTVRRSIQGSQ